MSLKKLNIAKEVVGFDRKPLKEMGVDREIRDILIGNVVSGLCAMESDCEGGKLSFAEQMEAFNVGMAIGKAQDENKSSVCIETKQWNIVKKLTDRPSFPPGHQMSQMRIAVQVREAIDNAETVEDVQATKPE